MKKKKINNKKLKLEKEPIVKLDSFKLSKIIGGIAIPPENTLEKTVDNGQ